MLSSFLDTLLKVSKTTYPQKHFDYDCVTLYIFGLKCYPHPEMSYYYCPRRHLSKNCSFLIALHCMNIEPGVVWSPQSLILKFHENSAM